MKKVFGLILALVLALGCVGGALADETVTLRLWMWDDAQQPAIRAMADEYEASHSNVKIDITCLPAVGDLNSKIQATIGTPNAPEVFFLNYNLAAEYIPMDFVQDLTDYNIDMSGLAEGIVGAYTVDGRVYAVAKDTDSFAVFYNKALFDAANVPYPQDDWTIADFCETAKKLTSDNVIGWTNSTSDRVYYNFIYSEGGSVYSEDGTKAAVNSPEAARAMQPLMDLMKDGYAYDYNKLQEIGETSAFTSGIAAMAINGSWMISQYAGALGENLGIAELPSGQAGKFSANHGIGFATTTSNQHLEETVEFLRYLATDEAQVKQIEVVIPAALNCAAAWEEVYPDVNLGAFKNALGYGRGYLSNVNASLARSAFQEEQGKMLSGEYATAEEWLAAAAEAMDLAMED